MIRVELYEHSRDLADASARAELKAEFSRWSAARSAQHSTTVFERERIRVAILKLDRLAATATDVPSPVLANVQKAFSWDCLSATSPEWQQRFEAVGFTYFSDTAAEFCDDFFASRLRWCRR